MVVNLSFIMNLSIKGVNVKDLLGITEYLGQS